MRLGRRVLLLALFALAANAQMAGAKVVISQVYGDGANGPNSTWDKDYVVLFNDGTTSVNMNTWAVVRGAHRQRLLAANQPFSVGAARTGRQLPRCFCAQRFGGPEHAADLRPVRWFAQHLHEQRQGRVDLGPNGTG